MVNLANLLGIPQDGGIAEGWKTLTLEEGQAPRQVRLPAGPALVPLAVWKARRTELIRSENEHGWPLGVWLGRDENIQSVAQDLDDFSLVAFAVESMPRGEQNEIIRGLREKYGYTGEISFIRRPARHSQSLVQPETGFGFAKTEGIAA
ncbi:MAG TPA: DUF934 domain-containing protein [Gallionellaceae bacterium]